MTIDTHKMFYIIIQCRTIFLVFSPIFLKVLTRFNLLPFILKIEYWRHFITLKGDVIYIHTSCIPTDHCKTTKINKCSLYFLYWQQIYLKINLLKNNKKCIPVKNMLFNKLNRYISILACKFKVYNIHYIYYISYARYLFYTSWHKDIYCILLSLYN